MTETKTGVGDEVFVMEFPDDNVIFLSIKKAGRGIFLSESGIINLLLWFKENRPDLMLDVIK